MVASRRTPMKEAYTVRAPLASTGSLRNDGGKQPPGGRATLDIGQVVPAPDGRGARLLPFVEMTPYSHTGEGR